MAKSTSKKKASVKSTKSAKTETPPVATVELYYYEFCENNMGVWDREWDLDRAKLAEARRERLESHGKTEDDEQDLDGSYGDVDELNSTVVPLTPEGLLSFAQNFGVDRGSC